VPVETSTPYAAQVAESARLVADALAPFGVTITEQPLTPSRIVGLLEDARRGGATIENH